MLQWQRVAMIAMFAGVGFASASQTRISSRKSVAAVYKGGNGCSSSAPCGEGEGDCDNDSHCKAGLKCFQRSGGQVPGVALMAGIPSWADFCYNPDPCIGGVDVCIAGYEPVAANIPSGRFNPATDTGLAQEVEDTEMEKQEGNPWCFPLIPFYDQPSGSLQYNTCKSCKNRYREIPGVNNHRTYPDKAGCSICPEGQYPMWHRLSGSPHSTANGEAWGTVRCMQPNFDGSGYSKSMCYPFYTADSLREHSKPLPISCNIVSITRTLLGLGTHWNHHVSWNVGCLLWKHTYCADVQNSHTGKRVRKCAVTKKLKWLYVDSCRNAKGEQGLPGRDSSFRYNNCEDGCPNTCTNAYEYSPHQLQAQGGSIPVQLITNRTQLPQELKEYDDTYGLCNVAALTT